MPDKEAMSTSALWAVHGFLFEPPFVFFILLAVAPDIIHFNYEAVK